MLKNFRYFMLSFVTALLVWTILYMFLVYVVHPQTLGTAHTVSTVSTEEPYSPSAKDAITILFMGSLQHGDAPNAYLLARFDPTAGQVTLAALPANAAFINTGHTESLAEIYNYGGSRYTQELIAKTLGISIDCYVRLTPQSFLVAMQAIGSMEYNLPHTLNVLQDGALFELTQGTQLLDSRKTLQILSYPYQTAEAQTNAITDLVAELILQRRDIALSSMAESVFTTIVNKIDSDISYTDYLNRKEATIYFALLDTAAVKQITLAGQTEAGLYHLSDTFIAEIRACFG